MLGDDLDEPRSVSRRDIRREEKARCTLREVPELKFLRSAFLEENGFTRNTLAVAKRLYKVHDTNRHTTFAVCV